ncbi:ABC transporter permease subunit, partial [Rhizobium ruizarguesonis]
GGRIDALLMRATDIVLSFPSLILALSFAAALGAGLTTAIIAISLTAWPPIARLARAEALVVRNADYVVAEEARDNADQQADRAEDQGDRQHGLDGD